MAYKMFSEQRLSQVPQKQQERLSQAGQKKTKHWYKIFFLKHILWVLNIKKLHMSIKIAKKRKTKSGKTYGYQMLVSFKTLVTFFNFTPDSGVRSEAAFP